MKLKFFRFLSPLFVLLFVIGGFFQFSHVAKSAEEYECTVGPSDLVVEPGNSYQISWWWVFTPPIPNEGGGSAQFNVGASSPSGITTTFQPSSIPYQGTNRWDFTVASGLPPGTYTMPVTVDVSSSGFGGTLTCNNVSVTITPMSGSLAGPSSCTINSGQSSCSVNLNWTINNPEAIPTAITSAKKPNINVSTSTSPAYQSGTQSVNVSYNGRTPSAGQDFYLYNNALQLASKNVVAQCVLGTQWTGTACTSPPYPSGTLSAQSCTIPFNASTCNDINVTWTTSDLLAGANTAITATNASRTLSTSTSGSNQDFIVNYGPTTLYLYHNELQIAPPVEINAVCAPNSAWDTSTTPGKCKPNPVHGRWSDTWGACSATACGTTGTQTRLCNNPSPEYGGLDCTDPANPYTGGVGGSQSCNAPACPTGGSGGAQCSNPANHLTPCASGSTLQGSVNNGVSSWTWTCAKAGGTPPTMSCTELKKKPIFIEN